LNRIKHLLAIFFVELVLKRTLGSTFGIFCLVWLTNFASAQQPSRLLSDGGFYAAIEMLHAFRFTEAEAFIRNLEKDNPKEALSAHLNLLWWQGLISGENNPYFDLLKDYYENHPPKDFSGNDSSAAIIHRLTAATYIIRIAAMEGNRTRALKIFREIQPDLRGVLSEPDLSEEYLLLAGVYNFAAGGIKSNYLLLRPLFVFFPPTNLDEGRKQLHQSATSSGAVLQTEAEYFLFKIENEINGNTEKAQYHIARLVRLHPGNIIFRIEEISLMKSMGLDCNDAIETTNLIIENADLQTFQKDYLRKQLNRLR
jgi:hypothetical protein